MTPLPRLLTSCLLATLCSISSVNAKLVFEDHFNRKDGSNTEDAIGNNWTTNSAWRADGKKQTFLKDGQLTIKRLEHANHAVSVKHDFPLSDCTIAVRFKLGSGDRLGVNFNDPNLKTAHAGHVCSVRITNKELSVADQKNGSMNLVLRERRHSGDKSDELKALIARTEKKTPLNLNENSWHDLRFQIHGDTIMVFVDDVLHLKHDSPGYAHATKENIALSVPKNVVVDYFQVWDQAEGK